MDAEPTGWETAWTGGRRCVHVGNVADFNAQFLAPELLDRPLPGAGPVARPGGGPADRLRAAALRRFGPPATARRPGPALDWPREGHHYAGLAPFYSPHPAAVVLPQHLDRAWLDLLTTRLEWDQVGLFSGIAEDDWLWPALLARPHLLAELRGLGLPLVAWGRSPGDGGDTRVHAAVRRFESKRVSLQLFAEVARAGHPEIRVRQQLRPDGPRALARALARRAAAGQTSVLKAEYGVGGLGTVVLTPDQIIMAGGALSALGRAMDQDPLIREHGMLLEPYVEGADRLRDVTFDAVVATDGRVHPVGAGVMHLVGTGYQGATIGPGLLPRQLAVRATGFGVDVGKALAAAGYRGWFDVDFVLDRQHRLAPMEANLRLTGPSVGFMIKARLDRVRGPGHLVRTLDHLPLGARLSEQTLFDHLTGLARRCAEHDVLLLPTMPGTAFEPHPTVGVALVARSLPALDTAEALVRAGNSALGRLFGGLSQPS
ncbi:hypothetical protein ACIGXM_27270 [Kitasatospora sp. NPDC052896]|uniref:hypothetical protein n=1 Tax=Kitasatospora sp. NPDC052896 TaxID=3364061 RepID=UPI0037C60BB2